MRSIASIKANIEGAQFHHCPVELNNMVRKSLRDISGNVVLTLSDTIFLSEILVSNRQ